MTDERDRPDAAADGDATDDAGRADGLRGHSQTALATQPLRPTGKRSRRGGDEEAGGGGGVDVVSTATEISDSDAGAQTKPGKAKKAAKNKHEGPARNPFVYVYNYLKQVVAELRKVIWPNRKQMITYTSVVLGFLVFMVALIAGSDYGFAKLVLLVFGD